MLYNIALGTNNYFTACSYAVFFRQYRLYVYGRRDFMTEKSKDEQFLASDTCDSYLKFDNGIEDEIEPEEDSNIISDLGFSNEELAHQFTRYERSYRARRIRELTLAPLGNKRRGRPKTRTQSAT